MHSGRRLVCQWPRLLLSTQQILFHAGEAACRADCWVCLQEQLLHELRKIRWRSLRSRPVISEDLLLGAGAPGEAEAQVFHFGERRGSRQAARQYRYRWLQ